MLYRKLSNDVSKRSRAEQKRQKEKKRLRIAQHNDQEMIWASLFTGDGSKMDKLRVGVRIQRYRK